MRLGSGESPESVRWGLALSECPYIFRFEEVLYLWAIPCRNGKPNAPRSFQQFTTLGDLRPGSICAVARRCGKPTCHCAKPNDPGHDPQLRLTRKVGGQTIAESFPSPAAWNRAKAEIEAYHRDKQQRPVA